jgi:triosephosphate isomerase
MRERTVVGNWKMNPPTIADAVELARAVAERVPGGVSVGVAPPAIALTAVADALRNRSVGVYAQDLHWAERGAFTGQISAAMVRGLAVGTLVGHSEVRRDLCEDDTRVAKKVVHSRGAGLRVVVCVGESEAEFERNETDAVLDRQVRAVAAALAAERSEDLASSLMFAYEPIWAIGTGRPATARHAAIAAAKIRAVLRHNGISGGDEIRVLYGGSVTAKSVGDFAGAEGIDGALVGGASLDPDEFAAVVRAFA